MLAHEKGSVWSTINVEEERRYQPSLYRVASGARSLSDRTPDSQSREPGLKPPLLPFRSLGIFVLLTTPQSTQLAIDSGGHVSE